MRARGQVRKASRVPPHAYCRALLIGPDPGGMKYKNRNKAPLPVPGEMLRYRIRDSGALLPARANKRTPATRYYRRSLPVSFFPPSSLSNVALPASALPGAWRPRTSEGKDERDCSPASWRPARLSVCVFSSRLDIPQLSAKDHARQLDSSICPSQASRV